MSAPDLVAVSPDPDHPGPPVEGSAGAAPRDRSGWRRFGVVDCVKDRWHDVEKRLARQPLARLSVGAPRTARWAFETIRSSVDEMPAGFPQVRVSPALVSQVAMDESIMAIAVGPNRMPRRADYERVGEELRTARRIFEKRGWLDDPASFHSPPGPVTDPVLTKGWALGVGYERIWWPSGYRPHEGVPGGERWSSYEVNRTASAWILRHDDGPRPWAVLAHGFGTGSVFMDLFTFRAKHLHEDLGMNVAAIILPVHGSRKVTKLSGEAFLGFDLMNVVHALAQSVYDVRSLIGWVRQHDPTGIGLFGVSLGSYVAALTAAFDSDLDLALAGIPVVDFVELIRHHAPAHVQMRAIEHHILDETAADVHRVVSPLAMPCTVPHPALAIFAGLGDRLSPPDQAHRLWRHWDEPETLWFPGNHVGYLWSDKVWSFVDEVFRTRGLTR